ncbi:Caffeine dehydrogenase subunit alpha [Baekduia alba]|uniref:xanthine dehydrogenase family protein molybdopterin-binding subunit n=1 Tax=Baekduia alba TaxID=2997333 RepID=UPI0023424C76|nr:xanthine dehydrogenase family protein molybdopterin-binding subunit [Baekduia alba]WCB94922.1 Caffeine dehydrogenase subunit alpha [Baekduia alba]
MRDLSSGRPPQYVGARIARVEDPKFLTGRAKYVDDVSFPGLLHAAFLRSPYAHARITSIDTSEALALDGVVAVFTGRDLESVVPPMVASSVRPDVLDATRRVLPVDKVRFVGEAIVMVIATSRYLAEDACDLIDVDYDPLPVVIDGHAALAPDAPILDESLGTNTIVHGMKEGGDVPGAFARAEHVFEKKFHFGRSHAAPLEGRAVMADWDTSTGAVTIWISTQIPHLMRTWIAELLEIQEARVRVITPAVGGGFGLKCHLFPEEVLMPVASRLLGRPVKWIEDRYEALAASSHSREISIDLRLATDAEGHFLAMEDHVVGNAGAYSANPFTPLIDVLESGACLTGVYDVVNARYWLDSPLTNKCPSGAYRAVGMPPIQCARELLIDEAARQLGRDPIDLRLQNMIADGGEVHTNVFGHHYDGGSYQEAVSLARDELDYSSFRTRQEELRTQGRYLGFGLTPFVEPAAFGAAASREQGYEGTSYFDSARVTVEPDGTVTITTGLHSHGQGLETTLAQVTADALGARLEDVHVVFGDTANAVYAIGTFASRSAVIGNGMITRAAAEVRERMLRLAAHMLEANPGDLEAYDGVVSVKGDPAKAVSFRELANHAYFGFDERDPDMEEYALTSTRSYDPPPSYPNGVVGVIAEVDPETGEVTLERIVAVEDCGVMLNPTVVDGQLYGAIVQGIGDALYEDLVYDEDGQFLSGSLVEFLYPTATEVPPIELHHLCTPSPVTEGGVKGMAEGALIATPAAIACAVADALSPFGAKVDATPLHPERVLDLIHSATDVPA